MTIAENHIRHYNNLNGKEISKETLTRFHVALKKDIDSKRIDAHVNYGVECITIERRIARALKKMNGTHRIANCKPIHLGKLKLLITQTARGPEVVRAKKAVHYHHEDLTYLYGIPCIQDDQDLDGKSLGVLGDLSTDVYKVITDRILALIEAGGLVWRKPWNTQVNSPTDLAHNGVTKFAYRGVNYFLNFLNAALGGFKLKNLKTGQVKVIAYNHMDFYTFKQVKTLKGHVKAGEGGWPVTYFKWLYKDEATKALVPKEVAIKGGVLQDGYSKIPGYFYYTVFNYEQCDGFVSSFKRSPPRTDMEKIESAERIVEKYSTMPGGPPIHVEPGSDQAYYSITKDTIHVPSIKQFKTAQQYYSVLFHEMVHSTGAESRLKRELTGHKPGASKGYAFEELIAEMGACFLCGESGILYYTMKNSAAYVQSWSTRLVKEMKEDPKFFLKACSAAQRATDFILGRVYEPQEKKEDEKPEEQPLPSPTKKDRKPVPKKERKPRSKKERVPVEKESGPPKMTDKDKETIDKLKEQRHKEEDERLKRGRELLDKEKERQESLKPKDLGFITADRTPDQKSDTFILPGSVGSILGKLQSYKLEIVIAGETHSSKSELGKQIADAFLSAGYTVGWVDWEQGGLQSKDTRESIERNVSPGNRKKLKVSADVPKNLDAVKSLAGQFDVIILDSGTSLKQITNEWIDQLREHHPDTIWIVLMQQNTKGGTRGGTAAEFDSPIVLKTYRPDHSDFKKNYAYVFKNRGNPQVTGKFYLIADKKVISASQPQQQPA